MTIDEPLHEHLDLERAADFDERLLDPAASADVAARVASCPSCAATLDIITRTRGLLSGLPPVAMPAAVAARLQAAVDAETRSAQVPGGATTVTALAKPRRRLWLPIGAGIAAAGAIALTVSGLNSRSHDSRSALAHGAASSSPAASAGAAFGVPLVASGNDYAARSRDDMVSRLQKAAPAPPAADYRGPVPQSASAEAADGARGSAAALPTSNAAAPAAAATAATAATASASSTAASPVAGAPVSAPVDTSGVVPAHGLADGTLDLSGYGALQDPAVLEACITRLIDPQTPSRPTLIDYASYKGKPALAVFFASDNPGESDVFVVGTECGRAKDDVLLSLRLPTVAR